METVKQYIDSLFDNLPKTKDVKEAREHLLEMAEDKYSDFKSEGMTAQEAAGRVIAELGTADELREELHLPKDIRTLNPDQEVLKISTLQQMIKDYMTAALLKAGAFACLIGLCLWPAFLWVGQWVAILMILTLTAAIVMFIIRKSIIEKWASRNFSKAVLDPYAEDEIRQEWEARKKQALTMKCLAAVSIMCSLIIMFFGQGDTGFMFFYLLIALGVFLYIGANGIDQAYLSVLSLSPANAPYRPYGMAGTKVVFENKTLGIMMKIYWPVVICLAVIFGILTSALRAVIIGVIAAGFIYYMIREMYGKKI